MNTEKQKRKKGYKNSGIIRLLSTKITEEVSFLDYIRGGTQMHFAVAIDFTASNGDPRDQRSLHFLDYSGRPNSYEIALRAVGEVIKSYDTQGMFPAYGFGAKIPPHGQVSHIFPLNNNPSHPYCRGIDEIVNCYKTTLNSVTLSGPTNFAPTVNSTANIARGLQDGKHYFVLLIITDGVISDMAETMDAIVNASSLPISLIIIGVGNADFSAMQFLDADKGAIVSRGRRAVRDIVQFVPLSKYVYNNWEQNQYELGREVLAEIPTQFKQFMQSRGFRPSVAGTAAQTKGGFPEPTTESVYPSVPTDATFQPSAAASHGPYPPSNTAHNYPPPVASNVYPPTNQMYAPSALITSSTTQPTYASSQPFYSPYGQFSYPNSGAPANPPPNASMNVYPQPSTMPPNPHSTYPPSYPPQY